MSSPDNQGQIHAATSLQSQLPQMQLHMHGQVRPQPLPVHMSQGPNMARIQRPQIMRGGQMPMEQPPGSFVGGQPRVSMLFMLFRFIYYLKFMSYHFPKVYKRQIVVHRKNCRLI